MADGGGVEGDSPRGSLPPVTGLDDVVTEEQLRKHRTARGINDARL